MVKIYRRDARSQSKDPFRHLGCGAVLAIACSLLFTLAGCEVDGNNPMHPSIPADYLLMAPQAVVIGGMEYGLEAILWRDFMPITPPDGRPLIALIHVVERNGDPVEPDLKLEYLWIINGPQIWGSEFSDEDLPPAPESELHGIVRDGPKWGPGIPVDVVVGLRRGNDPLVLLRAPDQWIARTD